MMPREKAYRLHKQIVSFELLMQMRIRRFLLGRLLSKAEPVEDVEGDEEGQNDHFGNFFQSFRDRRRIFAAVQLLLQSR